MLDMEVTVKFHPSNFNRYRLLAAATVAALVTATSVFGSGVMAGGRPDGGQEEASSEVLPQAVLSIACGSVLNSEVKTDDAPALVAPGAAYVSIPNANASVTIPANQSDCVKATYTVEAAALGPDAADFCYVRALLNGVAMDPRGGDQVLASEDPTAEAAGYVWIARRTAGAVNTLFTVVIQWRGEDADTSCWRDDSTLVVERLN